MKVPVIILTATPYLCASSMVCLVSGRGGSRKVSMPNISHRPSALVLATASDLMDGGKEGSERVRGDWVKRERGSKGVREVMERKGMKEKR